jgi:hypothetical protein
MSSHLGLGMSPNIWDLTFFGGSRAQSGGKHTNLSHGYHTTHMMSRQQFIFLKIALKIKILKRWSDFKKVIGIAFNHPHPTGG